MKNVLTLLFGCIVLFTACNTAPNANENNIDTTTTENKVEKKAIVNSEKLQKRVPAKTTANQTQKGNNKKQVTGSGKINWVNFEQVQALIKQQPKKILVDAYTDWCGWCKRMDKNTFENPVVAKYINDNFYAVKFNAETKETIKFKGKDYVFVKGRKRGHNTLAKELLKGRLSYPTISFLDENLNLINAFPGYKSPQKFDALMTYINNNEFDKMGFTQYKASYKSEIPEVSNKINNQLQKKVTAKTGAKRNVNLKNKIKINKPNIIKQQNKKVEKSVN